MTLIQPSYLKYSATCLLVEVPENNLEEKNICACAQGQQAILEEF